jgi:hypothetical protein
MKMRPPVAMRYALSASSWTEDLAGIAWEAYQTMGYAAFFHGKAESSPPAACCAPKTAGHDPERLLESSVTSEAK